MRWGLLLALIASLWVLPAADIGFAFGPDSSWEEIQSTPFILIQAPMIWFGVHAISGLEVCRSGDKLRSRTSEGVTVEAPLGSTRQSYNIEVDRIVVSMRRTREVFLFTKRFDIPPCGEPAEERK